MRSSRQPFLAAARKHSCKPQLHDGKVWFEEGEHKEPELTRLKSSRSQGKRVVLLGSFAPSLVNFRGPLIFELARRHHEVFAIAPAIDSDSATEIGRLGATPLSVDLGRGTLNPFRALKIIAELRRILTKLNPDVIIAYTINPIVLGAIAAKPLKCTRFVPLITGLGFAFTGGGEPKRVLSRALAKILYRNAFRQSDLAVFQNPDDKREFERLQVLPSGLRTETIAGSGVDLSIFSPAPLPEGLTFLMIARFLKDKGIREFAQAAIRLKAKYPSVRILIVGWRDQSPNAINQNEIAKIVASGIEVIGRLSDVRPVIASCNVYVLPSYREGTPRSVLEAMAMGRPIITTDAPGCRETVVHGMNGYLVPPRDADALFYAMQKFIGRPDHIAVMGSASRKLAEEKFDVLMVNEALLGHVGL